MSKPILIAVIIAAMILLIAVGTAFSRTAKTPEESSAADSAVEEIVVVPSEMPDKITMAIPAGFSETSSDFYDKYYIKDDASIIITGEKTAIYGQSAKEYAANVRSQYEQTVTDFTLLSEETITVSQVPCEIMEFSYAITSSDDRRDFQCMTAVIIKDNYVYLITSKSKRETFGTYRGAFRQMIESIQIASDNPMYQNPDAVILPGLSEETQPADAAAGTSQQAPAEN